MTPTGPADPGPPSRDYKFFGLAALMVVFAGLALRGGVLVAGLAALVGAVGLVRPGARGLWAGFLVALVYGLMFPHGIVTAVPGWSDVPGSQFRASDVLLTGAALLYFACLFRLQSVSAGRPDVAADGEFPRLAFVLAGCVAAGQLAWAGVTLFRPEPLAFPPVAWAGDRVRDGNPERRARREAESRLVLLAGGLVVVGLAARFGFWYWRLARLTPEQGRLVLLDTRWREARRELSRQAVWRAWGRARGRRGDGS